MADLETIVAYLLGEGELDGKWFGDPDVPLVAGKYKARYWWRTHLREAWNNRHGAGDAEAWRSMDDVPPHDRKYGALGKEYLIWPVPSSGERTAFFGRRLGGKARWYKYGAPVHGVTHWRPLPAAPTDEAARAGERGATCES